MDVQEIFVVNTAGSGMTRLTRGAEGIRSVAYMYSRILQVVLGRRDFRLALTGSVLVTLPILRAEAASQQPALQRQVRLASASEVGDGGPAVKAFLDRPSSIALDKQGNLYIGEQHGHRVRRVDAATGIISTIAGNGTAGSSGDGGTARDAMVIYPRVVVDSEGNIYVGEVDAYRIRRIDGRTGVITTIAGTGVSGFDGDGGPARAARITRPFGLALDAADNLYFTDTEVNRVRRIDRATGIITTVAGNGRFEFSGDGGPASSAGLARPHVIVFDPDGNLIIGDSFNQRIRRVDRTTGIITTIAGSGYRGAGGDGGPALRASFINFGGLAYDKDRNLIVSGVGDHRIRRIDARTGIIDVIAGTGRWESGGDGGHALQASFHPALELAVDAANNIYVADAYGGRVRKIDGRTGIVTTVAGERTPPTRPNDFHWHYDEAATQRTFNLPVQLTLPGADRARRTADLDYTETGDARRRLDLYLPADAAGRRLPAVVLVHGSTGADHATPPKDWGGWISRARLIAASGLAAVTFTHRLTQERGLDEGASDLMTALRYLRRHATALGLDAERMCVTTFSDGSPLLAQLLRERPAFVRCVAAFYPYIALGNGPPPFWVETDSTVRARYSLLTQTATRWPATMILIGRQDSEAINGPIRHLAASASEQGIPLTLLEHPSAGHDFDRGSPGPESERLLRGWLAFLHQQLR